MTRYAVGTGAHIFSTEIAEAKRLGFELQVSTAIEGQVTARMQPRTPTAHAACERATGKTNQAIESNVPVLDPADRLDCLREAIAAVIVRAREITE